MHDRSMGWIGRVCTPAMLVGRLQRRERCDGLNQAAHRGSQPRANLVQWLA